MHIGLVSGALGLLIAVSAVTARAQPVQAIDTERPPPIESDQAAEEVDEVEVIDAFAWELSLRGGASRATDDLTSQGMGTWLREAGIEMRGTLWRHLALAVGFQGAFGSDRESFQEVACEIIDDEITSNCYTLDSTISGFVFRAEAGAIYRKALGKSWQAVADLSLGYRSLSVHRGLDVHCSDCTHVELAADGGLYLSPEVGIIYSSGSLKGLGLTLGADVFLTGDIAVALWGGLLFRVL